MKILSNPAARCGIGILMVLIFGPLSALFAPLAIFVVVGAMLFLMLGEATKVQWSDSAQTSHCPHCQGECAVKAVKVKHYMHWFIPLPLLWQLFQRLGIHYRSSYYLVCVRCLEKHTGEEDFAAISAIAAGNMATVKSITKEEYLALVNSGQSKVAA